MSEGIFFGVYAYSLSLYSGKFDLLFSSKSFPSSKNSFFNFRKSILLQRILICINIFSILILFLRAGFLFYETFSSFLSSYLSMMMMAPSGSGGGSNSISYGSINIGSSSQGSGWTSFDLGVLGEPFPEEEGEEVALPNPHAPAVQAIPPEPNLKSVKDVMKDRLIVHRVGQGNSTVSDAEIDRIVDLKGQIFDRMSQLDLNPFLASQKNKLIRDYLRPPRGSEFKISVLEEKLQVLFGENPCLSSIFYNIFSCPKARFLWCHLRGRGENKYLLFRAV